MFHANFDCAAAPDGYLNLCIILAVYSNRLASNCWGSVENGYMLQSGHDFCLPSPGPPSNWEGFESLITPSIFLSHKKFCHPITSLSLSLLLSFDVNINLASAYPFSVKVEAESAGFVTLNVCNIILVVCAFD